MTNRILTLKDFSENVVKPLVLRGIENGHFDDILAECIADAEFYDPEILEAMLKRALIAATKKSPLAQLLEGDMKVGATLKIKLPS